eukprot:3134802-Prymnesium_polylepis.1
MLREARADSPTQREKREILSCNATRAPSLASTFPHACCVHGLSGPPRRRSVLRTLVEPARRDLPHGRANERALFLMCLFLTGRFSAQAAPCGAPRPYHHGTGASRRRSASG